MLRIQTVSSAVRFEPFEALTSSVDAPTAGRKRQGDACKTPSIGGRLIALGKLLELLDGLARMSKCRFGTFVRYRLGT